MANLKHLEHLFLLALLCSTFQCAFSGAWTEPSLRRASEDPQCTNIMQDIQYGAWTSDRSVCASPQPYLKTLCSQTPEKTSFVLSQMSASNLAPGLLWRPNNCSLKIFNGRSSRELLSRIGGFVVIGESVERHVAQGLLNVLSDDYVSGSLSHKEKRCAPTGRKKKYDPECYDPNLCKGELQFSEKFCRHHRVLDPESPKYEPLPNDFDFTFRYYANMVILEEFRAMRECAACWPQGFGRYVNLQNLTADSIVLFGTGLHEEGPTRLNLTFYERVQESFMSVVNATKKLPTNERPHLLWMNFPGHGNRPSQNAEKMLAFNAHMAAFASAHQVAVFDWVNASKQAYSFDNVHFGQQMNVVNAQILLNYAEELLSKKARHAHSDLKEHIRK